jgi:hypothetical protein
MPNAIFFAFGFQLSTLKVGGRTHFFASTSLGTPEHGAQKLQERPKQVLVASAKLLRNQKNYKKGNLNTKTKTK